jgi:glutamate synthase domain-containing protein 2
VNATPGPINGEAAAGHRDITILDPTADGTRAVNAALAEATSGAFAISNPQGAHALAAGLDAPVAVTIEGHVGYYCAGMNKRASVTVAGNAGPGVAENIMSGTVRVTGNASQSAGATGHGGLLVIEGNASARCGISMKGVTIVVGGNIGHMSAFMAQAGDLIVLGDAGADLGDSIYEARLFVRGSVASLGADCVTKEMRPGHHEFLARTLAEAGFDADPADFTRYGSARRLYNFKVDDVDALAPPPTAQAATDPGPDTDRPWHLRESYSFDRNAIAEIRRAANTGVYRIRGWGAKRPLPTFDDLVFLGASMSRYPLEGYREACATNVVLGSRFAAEPIELAIPITIAGMSFGSLSANAKEALGRGASAAGTSTTSGDGGMTDEERTHSETLVYQYLPSRYGMNPDDLRRGDAIEVVVGQGAKPGGGGMLLGHKISARVAGMRTLPEGIDQRSACRHPDWTGPDDLAIKITELREITGWRKPIYVKVGAARPYYDTALAVKAGADVVVLDGMQGGTAATQDVFIEHVGIPTLAAIPEAVRALRELEVHRGGVQLIAAGGIRSGADVAKALALGADAVSIGTAALIALGDNDPALDPEYRRLGSAAGFWDDFHTGTDPAGITTQDPQLSSRLDPELAGRRLANYLQVLTLEVQTLARACGKSHVLNLEPEDLAALTVEAAAMAGVPLAGTDWIPGRRRD